MRKALLIVGLASAVTCVPANAAPEGSAQHVTFELSEIPWRPDPSDAVAGAKVALLYGHPSREGVFVIRLVLPKGWRRAPHTHPQPEIITVLSGSLLIGHGAVADASKEQRIDAGGFSALPADMVHHASVDEETVIQISTTGPWSIKYVNPADDPRNKAR